METTKNGRAIGKWENGESQKRVVNSRSWGDLGICSHKVIVPLVGNCHRVLRCYVIHRLRFAPATRYACVCLHLFAHRFDSWNFV